MQLDQKFNDAIIETGSFRGDEYVVIKPAQLLEVCTLLRNEYKFDMLIDLCGADYPTREERFEVIYHLYSLATSKRLRLKAMLKESDTRLPSVCDIWKVANWFEREAFDMFGIHFEGHPNLKRLLTYEGFEGHALRKDYPKGKRQEIPVPDPLI